MTKKQIEKKLKVIVALSGGVDSAVAAALLKKQGYEVIGVFFHFFEGKKDRQASKRARKIAKNIEIKFLEYDARKEFKKKILDYFINSYRKGLTPNPCVVCNKEMKFRLLFDLMKRYKFDYVATGHYARLGREIPNPKSQIPNKSKIQNPKSKIIKLVQAKDKTKDQSYFLYRLIQKDLARIIFPLGEYKKSEAKKMAKKMKLPVLQEESQDICFVEKDIDSFLKKNIKLKAGNIIDAKGNLLGRHKGLPLYTIGQRKGIEIGGTGPYFVIGKNIKKNELIVTNDSEKLLSKKFFVNRANWIDSEEKFPLRAQAQIRYRAPLFSATIKKTGSDKWEVKSHRKFRAVTPGQSVVFYGREEVIGGGIIV